jgi:hypothetical protein
MQSRFVFSSDQGRAPKQHGIPSRVAGAIVFFFFGAIAATELYPQIGVHSDPGSGTAAALSPVRDTNSDRVGPSPLRDSVERTGGPIPPVPFGAEQPQTIVGTEVAASEARSASPGSVEKPRRTENKAARIKRSSHRGNSNIPDQPNREQTTYWATTTGANPWGSSQGGFGFGPRQDHGTQFDRRGQFTMWH